MRAGFELIGHAVEHLQFDGRLRQFVFFQQCQRIGDGADIVRAEGQFDAALVRAARHGGHINSAMRSKQASVSRLCDHTGTGQPICSAWTTS